MRSGVDLHKLGGKYAITEFWILMVHRKQCMAQSRPVRIRNSGTNRDDMCGHGPLLCEASQFLALLHLQMLVLVEDVVADRGCFCVAAENAFDR